MAMLFFWGLALVPLAQAIALAFIAPLIALFLAAIVLGESIPRRTVAASLIAFAGVLLIFIGQAQADLGREALLGSLAILASARPNIRPSCGRPYSAGWCSGKAYRSTRWPARR